MFLRRLVSSASSARADVVLTPYVGTLFGGDVSGSKFHWGASAAFMGGGIMAFFTDHSGLRGNAPFPELEVAEVKVEVVVRILVSQRAVVADVAPTAFRF